MALWCLGTRSRGVALGAVLPTWTSKQGLLARLSAEKGPGSDRDAVTWDESPLACRGAEDQSPSSPLMVGSASRKAKRYK